MKAQVRLNGDKDSVEGLSLTFSSYVGKGHTTGRVGRMLSSFHVSVGNSVLLLWEFHHLNYVCSKCKRSDIL